MIGFGMETQPFLDSCCCLIYEHMNTLSQFACLRGVVEVVVGGGGWGEWGGRGQKNAFKL